MNYYSKIPSSVIFQVIKYKLPTYCNVARHLSVLTQRSEIIPSKTSSSNSASNTILNKSSVILPHSTIFCRTKTYKNPKKTKKREYESDSESDDEYIPQEPKEFQHSAKVIEIQTDSLRCDLILKNGLGLSRNKIELSFYEGRIRVNGRKTLKKSSQVNVGDEVDLIKKFDEENPRLIFVGRIEIIKAKPHGDYIMLTVRRYKNLLIDNYEIHPWEEKPPESVEDDNEEEIGNEKK